MSWKPSHPHSSSNSHPSPSPSGLDALGWADFFTPHLTPFAEQGLAAGRVIFHSRDALRLATAAGETDAFVPGRLRHHAAGPEELPAVGDWVVFDPAAAGGAVAVEAVLPRRTALVRKAAGRRTEAQVVAANVDTVFLVMGLDGDYNLRRLERLVTLVWESGASPVVVLNKVDLLSAAESERCREETEATAPAVDVHLVSCLEGRGLEVLRPYLEAGAARVPTVALVGSSGAGKSTLVNRLAGTEVMATGAVREGDDRGRHTTTHRQLIRLPGGALLIDNPGVREVHLWSGGEGLTETFEDIEALAHGCRFRDCRHQGEPGCAVEAAVAAGHLAAERLENLRTLERELAYLERRQDAGARRAEQQKWKTIHKEMRRFKSPKRG